MKHLVATSSRRRIEVVLVILLMATFLVLCTAKNPISNSNNSNNSNNNISPKTTTTTTTTSTKKKKPTTVINLAESINRSQKSLQDPERSRASREQWKKALQEIKDLALNKGTTTTKASSGGVFSQWKLSLDVPTRVELDPETNITTAKTNSTDDESSLLLSSSTTTNKPTTSSSSTIRNNINKSSSKANQMPRFEGFNSWERMLQDWADDIQDYLDKIEAETTDYPLSNYGTPSSSSSTTTTAKEDTNLKQAQSEAKSPLEEEPSTTKDHQIPKHQHQEEEEESKVVASSIVEKRKRRSPITLPVPTAAKEGEPVLPETDLADKSKQIWIVTTAALPWMTGTAVNPLLRAAYMTDGREEAGGSVTLMLPWLERQQDQEAVYGTGKMFDTPTQQEEFIRSWLRDKAKLVSASEKINIVWYPAWQNKAENSLYSMGDITALIPAEKVDICILEEPEHLNWYRAPGDSWTIKFKHVVGIIHTNYFVYAQEQPAAFVRAPGMRLLCSWMCRAHCHRIVKLSGTLGQFAPEKELVENVHGVRANFLDTGEEVKKRLLAPGGASDDPIFSAEADPSVYFIGKMLWSKGLSSLMELLKYAEESAGISVPVDMYGGGPDKDAAEQKAKALNVDMEFHGYIDHGDLALTHKIFINPSTSEVLCTTVAEALAMGKFVVVPSHPSNDFFAQFPNCLTYTNKEEFVGVLYYALTHAPEPLSKEASYALSWEAATKRLEAAGSIPVRETELGAKALSSNDAAIEIPLPPLMEDKERKLLAETFRKSRTRYRQFRSRLSQEISQSNVLPSGVKLLLVNELDKRLDLDIDQILDTPKLRLRLSPAELDKRLLELYKDVADGPRGDVLRIIGGGNDVAFQHMYIKKQASKERAKNPSSRKRLSFGPLRARTTTTSSTTTIDGSDDDEEDNPDEKKTASQWVNLALRRNLPTTTTTTTTNDRLPSTNTKENNNNNNKMTMKFGQLSCRGNSKRALTTQQQKQQRMAMTPITSTTPGQFCPTTTISRKTYTLLI